LPIIRTVEKQS